MHTVFFELEPWEQVYLQTKRGTQIQCHQEALTEHNINLAKDAEVLGIFIYSHITAAVLDQLPRLRLIATCSTGYDHIDVAACRQRDIKVVNVPSYGENTVAEYTFALILALSRRIVQAHDQIHTGDFSLAPLRGFDLKGRTLGIVGMGHIGEHVAKIAVGFEMNLLVCSPHHDERYTYVPFEELLQRADIVSFHCPLTDTTRHLLNKGNIDLCKPGMLIINTARGAIIETDALVEGLSSQRIAGAGLDVLEEEHCFFAEEQKLRYSHFDNQCMRIILDNQFLAHHPHVIITPHNAFNSNEALKRILDTTMQNIEAFEHGKPTNLIH